MNQSQENIADILERITDAFVALDKNWRYTYMNKKAGEIFNRDPQKIIGKHIWTEFPEGVGQPFHKACDKAMATQQYIYLEEYYPLYNRWFENHIYPSPEGVSIFFRDITEKKKSESALELSNRHLEETEELTHTGYFYFNFSAGAATWSKGLCRIYGIRPEEFEGTFDGFIKRVHPDDRDYMNKISENLMEPGPQSFFEIRIVRPDGSIRHLKSIIKLIKDAKGRPVAFMGTATDITESKKAEQEIIEKERFIESIINSSPDIIYIYDIEERKNVYINEGMKNMLGYTDDEIKQMGNQVLPLLMPKEDFEIYLADHYPRYDTLEDKEIITHEFRMRDKKGNLHWLSTKESIFLRKADGSPKQIFGITNDITERKKAEEELVKSEELFSGAFHASPAGIIITRIADGKIIDANDAFLTMFEFSREETIGHTSIELNMLAPDVRTKLMQEQFESGGLVNHELLSYSKSGKPINLYFSSKQLIINDQLCHITTLIDITERKKAEKLLEKREQLLSQTQKIAHIGSWSWDISGHIIWSDETYRIYGVLPGEFILTRESFLSLIHPDDLPAMQRWVEDCWAGKKPGRLIFRSISTEGKIRWLNGQGELYHDDAYNPLYISGTVQDITESKKAEEEIKKANEQLRQLTAYLQSVREEERKSISREIHDELGQQLTAVKMDVAWIDKKIPEESANLKAKIKNTIHLLDSSNLSIRKILTELRTGVLEYQNLENAMEWQSRQFTDNTGIPVTFQYEIQEKIEEAATVCLFRVYQEALTNITRYAKAKKVKADLFDQGNKINLVIEDDGIGFDTEQIKSKKTFGILGMKERVHALNGTFELVSSKGKGTKIVVSLPNKEK